MSRSRLSIVDTGTDTEIMARTRATLRLGHGLGEGSLAFSVRNDEPISGAPLAVFIDGHPLRPCHLFVARTTEPAQVAVNATRTLWTPITAVPISADLDRQIVAPPPGVIAPFGPTRTLGWPDPTFTSWSTWGGAFPLSPQPETVEPIPDGKAGTPWGWLDPAAWWVWHEAAVSAEHPNGPSWCFLPFFVDALGPTQVVVQLAGDDGYEAWIGGQLIDSRPPTRFTEQSQWQKPAQTMVTVQPGWHELRVRGVNQNFEVAGNIGGVIASVAGLDGVTLARTDDLGTAKATGETPQGQTPYQVIAALTAEATARGCREFVTPVDSTDMGMRPWPIIEQLPLQVGAASTADAAKAAGDGTIEWWCDTSGATPEIRGALLPGVIDGAGVETAEWRVAHVEWSSGPVGSWGPNLVEHSTVAQACPTANALVVLTADGWETVEDAASIAEHGRYEEFVALGSLPASTAVTVAEGWLAATANLDRSVRLAVHPQCLPSTAAGSGDRPGVDVEVGGLVTVTTPAGSEIVQVVSVDIAESDAGGVTFVPQVVTAREAWEARTKRVTDRAAAGTVGGRVAAPSKTTPSVEWSRVVEPTRHSFTGRAATVGETSSPWPTAEPLAVLMIVAAATDETGTVDEDGDPVAPGDSTFAVLVNGTAVDTVTLPEGVLRVEVSTSSGPLVIPPGSVVTVEPTGRGQHTRITVALVCAPWPYLI
jgi:hypothetical protein